MATISNTINSGVYFGAASLTITSTGFINAGTSGKNGAALDANGSVDG